MRFAKVFFLSTIFIFGFQTLRAQDDEVIKVDTSIVRLNVGVVDAKGQPIINLSKQNFTVYEDGVKQTIANFSPTAAPLSIVMILDMSGSTLGFRQVIQQSAFRFVDALAPDDRVAVIEFYDKVNLRNDFTSNRKIIGNSIQVAAGRGKTQLYKALEFSLDKLAKESNRRKAIVVLTDGVDTGMKDNDRSFLDKFKDADIPNAIKPETSDVLNRILNKSDEQGVTIYPLALPTGDPKLLPDPTPAQTAIFAAARTRLQLLAERTGGTLNAINHLEDMGRIYARVAADVRALYTVEYQSTNEKRDGKWREIRIEVNNPELISRTRQGYYAK